MMIGTNVNRYGKSVHRIIFWTDELGNKHQEKWRDVGGYEGQYMVSDIGRVKSLDYPVKRNSTRKLWIKPGEVLLCKNSASGYPTVKLRVKNLVPGSKKRGVLFKVHRLVAKAFVGGFSEEKNCVNHIDGNKNNNFYKNLEIVSVRENNIHAIESGLRVTKIDRSEYKKIFSLKAKGLLQREIAEKYDVSQAAVSYILRTFKGEYN